MRCDMAQSVERATPGQEVVGSINALAACSTLVKSISHGLPTASLYGSTYNYQK